VLFFSPTDQRSASGGNFVGKLLSRISESLLTHSMNELMQWRGVRRLSVCKLLRKSLLLEHIYIWVLDVIT